MAFADSKTRSHQWLLLVTINFGGCVCAAQQYGLGVVPALSASSGGGGASARARAGHSPGASCCTGDCAHADTQAPGRGRTCASLVGKRPVCGRGCRSAAAGDCACASTAGQLPRRLPRLQPCSSPSSRQRLHSCWQQSLAAEVSCSRSFTCTCARAWACCCAPVAALAPTAAWVT